MKKIISLILCVALCCTLAFALASCGDEKVETKTLTVATSPDFPPFENLVDGEVVGIEVDIMKKICEELNYEIKFEQIAFDSVIPGIETNKYDCGMSGIPGIETNKYDCGMSGITVTPEREEQVLFTTPYCLAAQVIVVKADSTIASKADLEGKKVSVQLGTTADEFCREAGYTVDSYEANADAKLALTTGKVDAWVIDDLTAAEMCKNDSSVKILTEPMTSEPYAFAFNFDDEALVEQVDEIIEKLIANGTIKSIFEAHGAIYTAPAAN